MNSEPPIQTEAALAQAIAATPSPVKVTEEYIKTRIRSVNYAVLPESTVTVCNILLDNGFSVRGELACVDPANFRKDVGETIAYRNAFAKLWPLFGFLLAEDRLKAGKLAHGADVAVTVYFRRPSERDAGGYIAAYTRHKPMPGEAHQRGNDLADGLHDERTLDRVIRDLRAVFAGERA